MSKSTEIIGQKIVEFRPMTKAEMEGEGWEEDGIHTNPTVIVLENGTKMYPSCDEEGNDGGCLFGVQNGKHVGWC